MKVKSLSRVRPSAIPWTAAYQAPLSMGFSRQEYWSGVPLPSLKKEIAGKSLQLCPTLCHPIDGSPPGSPVPGILQARVLEWVAIAFSTGQLYKRLITVLQGGWKVDDSSGPRPTGHHVYWSDTFPVRFNSNLLII